MVFVMSSEWWSVRKRRIRSKLKSMPAIMFSAK